MPAPVAALLPVVFRPRGAVAVQDKRTRLIGHGAMVPLA